MATKNIGNWSVKAAVDGSGVSVGVGKMVKDAGTAAQRMGVHFAAMEKTVTSKLNTMTAILAGGGGIGSLISGLTGSGFAAGIESAVGVVQRLTSWVTNYVDEGVRAIKMQGRLSTALGVTRDQAAVLLAMGAVGGVSGADVLETAQKGLVHLGQLRNELAAGQTGGDAGFALRQLNIDPQRFVEMRSFADQLGLLGDRLRTVQSAAERAAIGHAILGKSFQAFEPQLRIGSEGMARMAELASRFGVAAGGEAAEGVSTLERRHKELRVAMQLSADGLRNDFTTAFVAASEGVGTLDERMQRLIARHAQMRAAATETGRAAGNISRAWNALTSYVATNQAMNFNYLSGQYVGETGQLHGPVRPSDLNPARPPQVDSNLGAMQRTVNQLTEAMRAEAEGRIDPRVAQRAALVSQAQPGTPDFLKQIDEIIKFDAESRRLDGARVANAEMRRLADQVAATRTPFELFTLSLQRATAGGLNARQRDALVANAYGAIRSGLNMPERQLPAGFEAGSAAEVSLRNQNAIQSTNAMDEVRTTLQAQLERQREMVRYNREIAEALAEIRRGGGALADLIPAGCSVAFTDAWEADEGRPATYNGDGSRDYLRTWWLRSDDIEEDGTEALLTGLLPPLYAQHPNDGGALLIKKGPAKRVPDSRYLWSVDLTYSTKLEKATSGLTASGGNGQPGSPSQQANENPLLKPPEIAFSTVKYQEALESDTQGTLIRNAAHEMFDPPVTVDRVLLCLDMTRNLPRFDPLIITKFVGATNSIGFLGFDPREILIDALTAKVGWEKNQGYWIVSIRMIFNKIIVAPLGPSRGGWIKRLLNAGYMKLVGGVQQRILLAGGQFPSRPQILNANGTYTAGAAANYLEFFTFEEEDFAELNLF